MKLKKYILVLMTLAFATNCKSEDREHNKSVVREAKQKEELCNNDLMTLAFLKKVSYASAIQACRLTIVDREFALNEIVPFGIRAKFSDIFSKEELTSSKKIKEVQWESKDLEYIIVWYLEKEEGRWMPFDSRKFGKDVRF